MAVANYRDTNGHYPPAYVLGPDGKPWHSWRILLLPFMEQQAIYSDYKFDEPWDGPNNRKLANRMPKQYAFSGDYRPENITTNYLAVVGPGTVWPGAATVSDKDVTDGLGETILLVENRGACVHWMEPRDLSFQEMDFAIRSPSGISSKFGDPAILTLDGTIYTAKRSLSPDTLRAMLTIRGGEKVTYNDGNWELLPNGRQP